MGSSFLFEHDLFRKPVPTFRDHVLDHPLPSYDRVEEPQDERYLIDQRAGDEDDVKAAIADQDGCDAQRNENRGADEIFIAVVGEMLRPFQQRVDDVEQMVIASRPKNQARRE